MYLPTVVPLHSKLSIDPFYPTVNLSSLQSPLLHVLTIHGVPSYCSLGDYYERRVRATYERVKARAAHLSQANGVSLCGRVERKVRGNVWSFAGGIGEEQGSEEGRG